MRGLSGAVVSAVVAFAATPLALQVGRIPIVIHGDTHFRNFVGSGLTSRHTVSQAGAYELFRMPKETTRPALINVRAAFVAEDNGVCGGLYLKNVSFFGEWLNGKVMHARWQDGFQVKVSSLQPAFAGPWRTLEDYSLTESEREELPDTIKITKTMDGEGLKFYLGPRHIHARPTLVLARSPRTGLDLLFSNVARIDMPEPAHLVGTDKQEKARTAECEAMVNPQYMIFGEEHVWNLVGEGFGRDVEGDYDLLRMPTEMERPALINVRGSFTPADNAPCGLRMTNFSITGEWVANKTVHFRHENGFFLKVSSTEPAFAGTWKALEDFNGADAGPEWLPDTTRITKLKDGSAFKLQLGPKKLQKRPTILISVNPATQADISMVYMKRFDTPEPSNALLTYSNHKASEVARCEANKINVNQADAERMPALQGLYQIAAPWQAELAA